MAEAHGADPPAPEVHVPHAADEHTTDDAHGHDDHSRAAAQVGPIDVQAWGAAAVGVVFGLLVVLALIQSLR